MKNWNGKEKRATYGSEKRREVLPPPPPPPQRQDEAAPLCSTSSGFRIGSLLETVHARFLKGRHRNVKYRKEASFPKQSNDYGCGVLARGKQDRGASCHRWCSKLNLA